METKPRKKKRTGPVQVRYDSAGNVVESLIFTRAQTGGNIYRQRFLLRLMELAQSQVKANLPVVHEHSRIFFDSSFDPVVEIPVRAILRDESDEHYNRAKRAILDFSSWVLVYEDDENYTVTPVMRRSNLAKKKSVFQFRLERDVWQCMFNFTKGFTVYNISVALSLENELALKIYKGLAKQSGEIFYTFEAFRKAYGFSGKYVGRNHDLVKNMIVPAKEELDAKSPWTFDYTLSYGYPSGRSIGRKSLVGISITPVHRLGKEGKAGVHQSAHPAILIGNGPYRILTEKLYFTFNEVKANVRLFEQGCRNLGEDAFCDWLDGIAPKAIRADISTQGYVVSSLRKYLRNKFGVVVGERERQVEIAGEAPSVPFVGEGQDASPSAFSLPGEDGRHSVPAVPSVLDEEKERGLHFMGDLFAGMDIESVLKG